MIHHYVRKLFACVVGGGGGGVGGTNSNVEHILQLLKDIVARIEEI